MGPRLVLLRISLCLSLGVADHRPRSSKRSEHSAKGNQCKSYECVAKQAFNHCGRLFNCIIKCTEPLR
jgi:hypothetical protein